MRVVLKKVDRQGRIVLPASWRKTPLGVDAVLLSPREGPREILPQEAVDLTAYFDAVEVDLEADLADWHGVRRGLRKREHAALRGRQRLRPRVPPAPEG